MEYTALDIRAFAFIITLAAVINGLGIVRWLSAFSEYLLQGRNLDIRHYWVFNLMALFQFLLHIIMWWQMWGFRDSTNINFLTYLYLLTGPVLLFLATAALTPSVDNNGADVRKHFLDVRPIYSTVLVLLWAWAIFAGPLLRGVWAPTVPVLVLFLVAAVLLRATANPRVYGAVVVFNWIVVVAYVAMFAMQLGGNEIQAG